MYTIYCHTFPNGKKYIGVTRNDITKRWGNGKNYKTCVLVCRAIEKYGWENIEHSILETAETKDDAEEKERYYIAKYKTTDKEFGYNILPGGDVSTNDADEEMRYKLGNGNRGRHHTEEEKANIGDGVRAVFERPESNGHWGMKQSEEAKRKMSESHKKRWSESEELRVAAAEKMRERMENEEYREKVLANLAKYRRKPGEWSMSDEAKAKLSKHNKGKWLGEKSPSSKPVLQFAKDGTFIKRWANAGEAERAGIANRANISKCCRAEPRTKSTGGYYWEFEDKCTSDVRN